MKKTEIICIHFTSRRLNYEKYFGGFLVSKGSEHIQKYHVKFVSCERTACPLYIPASKLTLPISKLQSETQSFVLP